MEVSQKKKNTKIPNRTILTEVKKAALLIPPRKRILLILFFSLGGLYLLAICIASASSGTPIVIDILIFILYGTLPTLFHLLFNNKWGSFFVTIFCGILLLFAFHIATPKSLLASLAKVFQNNYDNEVKKYVPQSSDTTIRK